MAAGTGERMNSEIPKQFMEINGLPIIIHTYKLFKEIGNLNIYIVLPSLDFEKWHKYISEFIDEDTKLCLLYTSPSPRDRTRSRMPSSA